MKNSRFIWVALIAILCGGAWFYCAALLPYLKWAWDDGNNYYPVVADRNGLLQNVDYISGYPGGMTILNRVWTAIRGLSLFHVKELATAISIATAVITFITTSRYFNFIAGFVAFMSTLLWGWIAWPSPNAGVVVMFLNSIILLIIAFSIDSRKRIECTLLVIGIVAGLSLCFKQSGIFGVIGFLFLATIFWPDPKRDRLWILFRVLALGLPLVGFLVLRTSKLNIQLLPNTLIAFPFILVLILVILRPERLWSGARPRWRVWILALATCFGTSVIWLAQFPKSKVVMVVLDLFVKLPGLIDRHQTPVLIDTIAIIAIATAILFWALFTRINWRPPLPTLLLLPAAVWLLKDVPNISPTNWPIYLLSPIFAGVAFFKSRNDPTLRLAVMFSSVLLASGYPYIGNTLYLSAIISFLMLAAFAPKADNISLFQSPKLAGCVILLAAILWPITSWQRLGEFRAFAVEYPLGFEEPISAHASQMPFIEIAKWVKLNVPPKATVYGYPNFALVFALSGRTNNGRYPSFIGGDSDILEFSNIIKSNSRPDFFIISESLFPYGKDNPFFLKSDIVFEALKAAKYNLVFTQPAGNGESIKIYAKSNLEE